MDILKNPRINFMNFTKESQWIKWMTPYETDELTPWQIFRLADFTGISRGFDFDSEGHKVWSVEKLKRLDLCAKIKVSFWRLLRILKVVSELWNGICKDQSLSKTSEARESNPEGKASKFFVKA